MWIIPAGGRRRSRVGAENRENVSILDLPVAFFNERIAEKGRPEPGRPALTVDGKLARRPTGGGLAV